MWFLRVAVVAALCGLGSLDIPDTPDYQKCANSLFAQMKLKLSSEMRELNKTIAGVAVKVESVCGSQENGILPSNGGAELTTKTDLSMMQSTLERKIIEFQKEIKRIVAITAKKQDVEDSLTNNNDVLKAAIETAVDQCATGQHVIDSLVSNNVLLSAALETAVEECGVQENETDGLAENRRLLTEIQTAVKQCVTKQQVEESLANTNTELTGIKTAMEQLTNDAQAREERYMEKIASLEEMLAEILNATQLPPPTQPPSVPALLGTVYPCEDSTFPRNNYGVCESAVRFNKCYLETVAYHCCRTCTDSGQLPEMGPWRYMNNTRSVNTLDVLRFFSL